MTKPRILLGTPVRDAATIPYLNGLWDAAKSITGYELVPAIAQACYINCARNDLVEKARFEGCEEIVFIDADLQWDAIKLMRLLSHGCDIVAGIYPKRKPGQPEWTAHAEEGAEPDENGLQRCNDVPAGFLRIKMRVFDRMDEVFRGRRFKHTGERVRTEYFPIGLVEKSGWRHPAEARLEAIAAVLRRSGDFDGPEFVQDEIARLIDRATPENELPELAGEDICWGRMAKHAGFTLFADTRLRLHHWGMVGFPVSSLPL